MRRLAGRLGAALLGYVAASLAGGFAYAFILAAAIQVTGSIAEPSEMSEAEQLRALVTFAMLASAFIATVAFPAALAALALLWSLRLTGPVPHILAGMAVSVAAVYAARHVPYLDRLEPDWITTSAGGVAGAAFWAVTTLLGPRPARES